MYIESHCHLDYLKNQTPEETLKLCAQANIEKIVTISVEPDNFQVVLDLADKYDNVFCSQGTHPHDAKLMEDHHYDLIKKNATHKKVVAIGEIGLDYHYDNSPRETQREVFKKQLQIAIDVELPVIIHSRDADEDMISILSEYAPKLKHKGVIHSFTSGQALADLALDQGFYLGFNGIVTFKKAEDVRSVLKNTPIERILLETDSPFLAPVPKRGRENSPHYIPYISQYIADFFGMQEQKLAEIAYQNTLQLFDFTR